FRPDLTPREYLAAAGGPSARAKVKAATVTFRNGRTYAMAEAPPLEPGAVMTVPEVAVKWWQDYVTIATLVASLVTAYTGMIGLLTNPSWNATDFLREALYQLGVESKEKSKSELLHLLNDVFFRNYRDGRDTVIIVDEAQLIADDGVFEEVRLLMNFQTDDRF